MWNMSKWSAKYLISHHFSWRNWPGRGQNSTAVCGGALGSALSSLTCSGRSASLDVSSWSGSGYSAVVLRSIGRNSSLGHRKMRESTQVSRGHSSCNCPQTSLWSSVSPNTNEKHASHHLWTLHAPEEPRAMSLSTRALSFACSSSVHSRSIRCAFSIGIRMSGFPLASFGSDHILIIRGFGIYIIRRAASCWATLSSVRIPCIELFTAEYNPSAQSFSFNVSSAGSSGAPENSHIVR